MKQALSRRIWGIGAIALALLAIPAQFFRIHHAGKGMMTAAKAVADKASDQMRPIILQHIHLSGLWGGIGAILVLLAITSWIIAYLRGEIVPRISLISLLVINLALAFLIA